jgi:hypothetical protein
MRYLIPIVLLVLAVTLYLGSERDVPDVPAFTDAEIAELHREAVAMRTVRVAAAALPVATTSRPANQQRI